MKKEIVELRTQDGALGLMNKTKQKTVQNEDQKSASLAAENQKLKRRVAELERFVWKEHMRRQPLEKVETAQLLGIIKPKRVVEKSAKPMMNCVKKSK